MNVIETMARHIMHIHHDQSTLGNNMTTALQDITPAEACSITSASPYCIAAIVQHLTWTNRRMTLNMYGSELPPSPQKGYSCEEGLTSDQWQRIRQDNLASARELAATVLLLPEEKWPVPAFKGDDPVYTLLQSALDHINRHLGQILLLKNVARRTTPQTTSMYHVHSIAQGA